MEKGEGGPSSRLRCQRATAAVLLAGLLCAVPGPAGAGGAILPGVLLVSEFQAGSLVDVAPGGALSTAPRFATGLDGPYGLCVGPGGDVYVAEFLSGEVTVATAGGDLSTAPPFAWGLSGPFALACTGAEVLVSELWSGEITDVSAGGDVAGAPPLATLPGPAAALHRDASGRLFAVGGTRLYEVGSGGTFSEDDAFAWNGVAPRALVSRAGRLYLADAGESAVLDVTAGGDLAALPVFAEILFAAGLADLGPFGLFAASDGLDALWRIEAGGDFATVPPTAEGVAVEFFAGMAFRTTCGDGAVDAGEQCDDGNAASGDGCSSFCQIQLCTTPPAAGCVPAARAALRIDETKPGRESLRVKLRGLGADLAVADFGNPVTGSTRLDVCVYDDADALVAELPVDRGGALCAGRACWTARGSRTLRYRDDDAGAAGMRRMRLRGGPAGRGGIEGRAANRAEALETRLPTGLAARLEGAPAARVQLRTSDAACFEARLDDVRRSDARRFRARAP